MIRKEVVVVVVVLVVVVLVAVVVVIRIVTSYEFLNFKELSIYITKI